MTEYCLVLVTAPDQQEASRIAKALLEQQAAACVNLVPDVNSLYRWEGEIADDREHLLIIKTRASLLDQEIIPLVKSLHSYDVPEIIALPLLGGSQEYLDWIGEETDSG